jgi:hypothetical protein
MHLNLNLSLNPVVGEIVSPVKLAAFVGVKE